jgi:restriction system protein
MTSFFCNFEHLIREIFEKYFAAVGAEVKVTKTSRDGGIHAVAFDPDPIRGGKFIIQAKRYNHVVPISALRELNGIMSDEGAVKGILVTTSFFGKDLWEFVKDKPLTLLDDSNLIQMFNDYGYNVRIELKKNEKAN